MINFVKKYERFFIKMIKNCVCLTWNKNYIKICFNMSENSKLYFKGKNFNGSKE